MVDVIVTIAVFKPGVDGLKVILGFFGLPTFILLKAL